MLFFFSQKLFLYQLLLSVRVNTVQCVMRGLKIHLNNTHVIKKIVHVPTFAPAAAMHENLETKLFKKRLRLFKSRLRQI